MAESIDPNSISNDALSPAKWSAALYVRLSKEDGDKAESDSITNQKALIRDYVSMLEDIIITAEMVDDGYSGVNFERPAFIKMMNEIKAGRINCVIVKDLSRFGRNFTETGKYIDKIFPFLGVRFLSVNDRIDSLKSKSYGDTIVVPFKNLINDAYCRDISIKIRSQLEIKRKKGDFISSFAAYGYSKNEKNHNKLVVDDYAADIVRTIFKWKIEGISQQRIADKLNSMGILSPMEYKKSIGLNYVSTFKTKAKAMWSAMAVGRILKDEIYIGVLTQGKSGTPNHKTKKSFQKSKDDWVRVPNAHKAVVSEDIFVIASSLLHRSTRISPAKETAYLFSGIVRCADCGGNMIRKTVPGSNDSKKYFYFICSNSRVKKCSTHSIKESTLEKAVAATLQNHIINISDIERIMLFIDNLPQKQEEIQKINNQILKIQEEIKRYKDLNTSAHETFANRIINENDYKELKQSYTKIIRDAEQAVIELSGEIKKILNNNGEKNILVELFKEHHNFTVLTRKIIVSLIEKILIYEDKKIDIWLRYTYNYDSESGFVQNKRGMV